MKVIIDRLEDKIAVVELEDGSRAEMPRVLIPEAKEGDVISIDVDPSTREKRERAVEELMNELFSD